MSLRCKHASAMGEGSGLNNILAALCEHSSLPILKLAAVVASPHLKLQFWGILLASCRSCFCQGPMQTYHHHAAYLSK